MNNLWRRLKTRFALYLGSRRSRPDTVELLRNGWGSYASDWHKMLETKTIPALRAEQHDSVRFLGDEWTVMKAGSSYYGIDFSSSQALLDHLDTYVLSRYLPSRQLVTLEIGSGGGRFTQLLLQYSQEVICTDISKKMLALLKARFAEEPRVKYLLTDGISLTGVSDENVDCVASLDTFVHIEPRQIFNYLVQFQRVMKPGGIGIIHHSNVDSEIGWQVFLANMVTELRFRRGFAAHSIMNPALMKTFVERAGFKVLALDCETLPRDCIAIFRKE